MKALTWSEVKPKMNVIMHASGWWFELIVRSKHVTKIHNEVRMICFTEIGKREKVVRSFDDANFYLSTPETKTWLLLEGISIS